MIYIVTKYEVWAQPVEIEAEDEEDAIMKVLHEEGRTIEDLFEYSHTLSPDDWNVRAE